jgi:ZIP family zinc transporter
VSENAGWLIAGVWGLVAGAALVLGALLAIAVELPHRVIAAVMGFGSGVLVHVLASQLIQDSVDSGGLAPTLGGFIAGAAVFSLANWLLARRGAKHRNRCGGCVKQPKETEAPGSGLAIAVGALLDGVPEALIIGLSVADGKVAIAVVAGFFSPTFRKVCRARRA